MEFIFFPDWLYISFEKLPFTPDPIEIGQLVPKTGSNQ